VSIAQRVVAGVFAAFLFLVAFGAMVSVDGNQQWLALAALLAGMIMCLWALRPARDRGAP
jgi:ABC-type nickel/cobalt efflux system permease component RcnA